MNTKQIKITDFNCNILTLTFLNELLNNTSYENNAYIPHIKNNIQIKIKKVVIKFPASFILTKFVDYFDLKRYVNMKPINSMSKITILYYWKRQKGQKEKSFVRSLKKIVTTLKYNTEMVRLFGYLSRDSKGGKENVTEPI